MSPIALPWPSLWLSRRRAVLGCVGVFFHSLSAPCSVAMSVMHFIDFCVVVNHRKKNYKKKRGKNVLYTFCLSWFLPISGASADSFTTSLLHMELERGTPCFFFFFLAWSCQYGTGTKLKQVLWCGRYVTCRAGKGKYKRMHFRLWTARRPPGMQPPFSFGKKKKKKEHTYLSPSSQLVCLLWTVPSAFSHQPAEIMPICVKHSGTWTRQTDSFPVLFSFPRVFRITHKYYVNITTYTSLISISLILNSSMPEVYLLCFYKTSLLD